MNSLVIFREAAGSCGQQNRLPKVRFRAAYRWVAAGLWFALALMASGLVFSPAVMADDDSWQDQPRRQPRTVAQRYADEQQPSRGDAADDDTPRLTPPVPHRTADSPSNQRSKRTKAESADEGADDDTPHAKAVARRGSDDSPSNQRLKRKKAESANEAVPDDDSPRTTTAVRRGADDSSSNQRLRKRKVELAAEQDPDDGTRRAKTAVRRVSDDSRSDDSPSNQRPRRKKAQLVSEVVPDDEPQPMRKTPSATGHPAVVDNGNSLLPAEPFENSAEENETDFGYCGPGMRGFLSDRVWLRSEALLWWARGGYAPPLLTTSSNPTTAIPPPTTVGALGDPDTTVLLGGHELNPGLHAGGRIDFGLWLDNCQESGLECSYLILGQNTQTYTNSSAGTPILARPFFDVNPAVAAQTAELIAFPQFSSGTFNFNSTENFQAAEALWRRAIVHSDEGRMDLLAGYRFASLTDGITIVDSSTTGPLNPTPLPGDVDTVVSADTFHTRNDFNGGDIGFATEWHRNRWSLDTVLKLGIGATHSQVFINGFTKTFVNGTLNSTASGGFLAQQSNMGYHDSDQFSMLPEIGFTLGYDLTPRLKFTVGYTLLYWSNVARPGDQIDLNIDSRQIPPPLAGGPFSKPEFDLHTSDFWAQGITVGADYRF